MKRFTQFIPVILICFFSLAGSVKAVVIEDPLTSSDIKGILTNIVDKLMDILGGVVAIMFIVSGIIYLTSAGNPEKINMAKKCLTYTIIGAVVVLVAKGIIALVEGWF